MVKPSDSMDRASAPVRRFVDYLGEVGPRWGLPAEACRVHGYLYAMARPVPDAEIWGTLDLTPEALTAALAWLSEYRLVAPTAEGWRTSSDPWELLLRALEERRRREIAPALDLLRACRRELQASGATAQSVQLGKLVGLVEDLAAIDTQAQRLSPQTLRRFVSFGGRVSRLLGGRGRRS